MMYCMEQYREILHSRLQQYMLCSIVQCTILRNNFDYNSLKLCIVCADSHCGRQAPAMPPTPSRLTWQSEKRSNTEEHGNTFNT